MSRESTCLVTRHNPLVDPVGSVGKLQKYFNEQLSYLSVFNSFTKPDTNSFSNDFIQVFEVRSQLPNEELCSYLPLELIHSIIFDRLS